MNILLNFFDINNIFFTVLGYPMSYLEFFGTLLTLWSVWLVARNNIWNWPIGILGVVLFTVLFFQIQLYSDFVEQIYYFITGFYGWFIWLKFGKNNKQKVLLITRNSSKLNIFTLGFIILGTLILGLLVKNLHLLLPTVFTIPASYPFLDAFTTVMSFAATILMAHRKLESWILWIVVDVIGIWLYFNKEVVFISLLYLIFLFLATKGLINWRKILQKEAYDRANEL